MTSSTTTTPSSSSTTSSSSTVRRPFDVDFFDTIRTSSSSTFQTSKDSNVVLVNNTYRIAHILSLLPVTTLSSSSSSSTSTSSSQQRQQRVLTGPVWYETSVAMYLAIQDFNSRRQFQQLLVPSLLYDINPGYLPGEPKPTIHNNCNIYFTIEFRDTQFSSIQAGKELYHAMTSTSTTSTSTTGTTSTTSTTTSTNTTVPPPQVRPVAMIGGMSSSISETLTILGSSQFPVPIPLLSTRTTSRTLDNKSMYPYFARTIPSNVGDAITLCTYFKSINVTHFGVLYSNDSQGEEYWSYLQRITSYDMYNLTIFGESYDISETETETTSTETTSTSTLDAALMALEQTKVHYLFGILEPSTIRRVMTHIHQRQQHQHQQHEYQHDQHQTWIWADISDILNLTMNMKNSNDAAIIHVLNGTSQIGLLQQQHQHQLPKQQQQSENENDERERDILHERLSNFPNQFDQLQHFVQQHKEGTINNHNNDNNNNELESLQHVMKEQFLKWASSSSNSGFQLDITPSIHAKMAYDAVMSLGISMCRSRSSTSSSSTSTSTSSSSTAQQSQKEEKEDKDKQQNQGTTHSLLVSGSQLFHDLKQVEFYGASGYVKFDTTTASRTSDTVSYELANILAYPIHHHDTQQQQQQQQHLVQLQARTSISFHTHTNSSTIGNGNGTTPTIPSPVIIEELNPLIFPDGTTQLPPTLPLLIENQNLISTPIVIFCALLAIVTMTLSIVTLIWTLRQSHRTVVRISQPIFLRLLCTGTFLMATTVLPLTVQENIIGSSGSSGNQQQQQQQQWWLNVACMSSPWFLAIGFSLTFSAMIAKTWRINAIIRNARAFRRVTIRPRDVLWPMVILTVGNVLLLTFWTIWNPLQWERIPLSYDEFNRVDASYGSCFRVNGTQSFLTDPGSIPIIGLVVINVGVLIFCNYQSYLARDLPTEYNESYYVALTNAILLEGLIIGGPLLLVVDTDPTSLLILRTLLIVMACWAILFPTFAPKLSASEQSRRSIIGVHRYVRLSPHDRTEDELGNNGGTGGLMDKYAFQNSHPKPGTPAETTFRNRPGGASGNATSTTAHNSYTSFDGGSTGRNTHTSLEGGVSENATTTTTTTSTTPKAEGAAMVAGRASPSNGHTKDTTTTDSNNNTSRGDDDDDDDDDPSLGGLRKTTSILKKRTFSPVPRTTPRRSVSYEPHTTTYPTTENNTKGDGETIAQTPKSKVIRFTSSVVGGDESEVVVDNDDHDDVEKNVGFGGGENTSGPKPPRRILSLPVKKVWGFS